ncbi:hypothetical protein QD47_21715 [Paenibacillus terrae]|uniref:Uncharacterized protein n=2 Tax=Paenibacillus terrae TaxID=159743 RepID=A0A0D7WY09_9BACL|nr:hypothetical protein QD47_21715 [Paenibacillus terrae]
MTKIISEWYCMAAAIPMGSLAPGGQFSDASKVVMGYEDSYSWRNDKGVTVWYSRLDSILSTSHVLASGTLAIGQTGALVMNSNIEDFDVTSKVGLTHTISDGYFTKLGIGAIYQKRMTGDPG